VWTPGSSAARGRGQGRQGHGRGSACPLRVTKYFPTLPIKSTWPGNVCLDPGETEARWTQCWSHGESRSCGGGAQTGYRLPPVIPATREDHGSKPAWENSSQDPNSKTPSQNRAGGVAQGEALSSKPGTPKREPREGERLPGATQLGRGGVGLNLVPPAPNPVFALGPRGQGSCPGLPDLGVPRMRGRADGRTEGWMDARMDG
jgi:hypothetical protein